MKKKILSALLAVAMVSSLVVGCGSSKSAAESGESDAAAADKTEETADTVASVAKKEGDTFTVGFDAEYPPYGYMDDNGDYTGFDLELAQAVCDMKGWKLVKTPIAWDSKDMELNSGSIDCIWNGFTMNGREDDYAWSEPYVDNSQVMVVADSSGITDLAGLSGKIVGVQASSAALELLQDEEGQKALADTFAQLQEFPDYNSAFVELQAGSVDAIAMDVGVAQYQLDTRGEGYTILSEALNSEQYGIGFRKDDTGTRDQVNEALKELVKDGTFASLAEKYGLSDMVCLTAE